MMQDIKLVPDENGLYDIAIEDSSIASVSGLQTSLVVSLFTDSRAPSSIVQEASLRRGWAGDILRAIDNRFTGSILWTLDQSRLTSDTVNNAEIAANDALSWLIDDEIADRFTVEVNKLARGVEISINIYIKNNPTERYNFLWRQTNASGISDI